MQEESLGQQLAAAVGGVMHELSAAESAARVEADFGVRVREARQIVGMTQRQLADAVGLDASAISRLEQGSRAIRLGEAALIADALKTDVRQLVYGKLSDDPRLELFSAVDELEDATSRVRDATRAAEVSIDHLQAALERAEVREYLSISSVDVDSVISSCAYVLNALYEDDHPNLLRRLSAQLVDMDEPRLVIGDGDGSEA
ncbi:helix-turn-helix domain-containing protein [Mycolicibacterium sp. 141076]|uniref:helix-turn-helix domain-containing protein n=1 Tax=Mycolicibacterium sp. 141076 TaxID=3090599 RepID=UPI00299CEEE5|nr:helix-turn-helix domain-containing protein [Mycolicibacterium sp. 141076]MDX1878210.1 helix-turn-helix domain-containing protein [Mycolicibacterium sp. 141076]